MPRKKKQVKAKPKPKQLHKGTFHPHSLLVRESGI